jgi:hypothetical protein
MTHDPMCPIIAAKEYHWRLCLCGIIASVRQDERINSLGTRVRELKPYADGYCDGQRDALNAAVQRVESLADDMDASTEWCRDYEADKTGNTRNPRIWIREAVAAIQGEQT